MKLQVLLACERIIEDPNGGPSLISVFTKFSVAALDNQELPSDAVLPRDWVIYTVWRLEEHESDKAYTLRSEIYWPDGTQFASSSIAATKDRAEDFVTFTGKANGFPIGQVGKMRIAVWVETDGVKVSDVEETHINVGRIASPEAVK
jgi:hypothetical protein